MISIIIPIFNAENSLRRMLDSVFLQTYTDFECILVDDGSLDASFSICNEYAKQDNRFYCYTQKNGGVSSARNLGLEVAKGQYIAFLDADDYIPQNYLYELMKCCEKGDIAVCDVSVLKAEKEVYRFTLGNTELTQTQAINELLRRKHINSGPCAKLFRKSVIEGLNFLSLKTYEDILFVLDSFSQSCKIVATSETQYFYIQNSTGAMSTMAKDPSLDIVFATDKLLQFINQRKDLQAECCYITVSHLYQYAISLLNARNYKTSNFIKATEELIEQNMWSIFCCKAMPLKEKVSFFLFTHGWVVQSEKKINRITKE